VSYLQYQLSYAENEITYSNSQISTFKNSSSDLMNSSFMSKLQFPALVTYQSSEMGCHWLNGLLKNKHHSGIDAGILKTVSRSGIALLGSVGFKSRIKTVIPPI
jgi:hypothetical protein